MSNSILDKLNEVSETGNYLDEEEKSLKPINVFPFFFAISLIFCLVLAACVFSLINNFSYDVNVMLDSYMIIISGVTGALMLFILIAGFIGIAKGFKISKLLCVVFSIVGIILAVVPFVIPGLLYL